MNAPVFTAPPPPRAPRKYTADDIFFWLSTGFVSPEAKFELLDGELIPVSPKGRHHEAMRERIEVWLDQPWRVGRFSVIREHTLKLDDGTLLEPDFLLYDSTARIQDRPLQGADIKLAIEVGDSSWAYDLNQKAPKYAAFGIPEYWAIHAVKRAARIHRAPSGTSWAHVSDLQSGSSLSPLCAPEAAFAA